MKLFLAMTLLLTLTLHANEINNKRFDNGKKIFTQRCVSCHALNGEANTQIKQYTKARDLKKSILREDQTFRLIKYGANHAGADMYEMPSFQTILSDDVIKDIAYFISKQFNPNINNKINELYAKSETVPEEKKIKMLKRGKKIYNRTCMWCHGMTGKGKGEVSRMPLYSVFPTDLTRTVMDSKQHFLYAKYGGDYWGGHNDLMPKWSPKYDDYTIKSVVKYIEEVLKKK